MDEELLRQILDRLRDLVPAVDKLGTTMVSGIQNSNDKLLTAMAKLGSRIEREGVTREQETKSMRDFIREVNEAAPAMDEVGSAASGAAADFEQAGQTMLSGMRESAKTNAELAAERKATERKLAQDLARQNYQRFREQRDLGFNYAQMQAEEEQRLSQSGATFRSHLVKMAGDTVAAQRAALIAADAFDEVGKISGTAAKFGAEMANGFKGFTQLNQLIDTTANAISKMAATIPFFGAAMVVAAEGSKFLLEQLQRSADMFRQVSAAGALGAEGMTGLQRQFVESGVSLDGLISIVNDNSQTLARFGGSVSSGTDRFVRFVGGITKTPLGDQLRNLGFSADEIGETAAKFVEQQSRLGRAQNMNQRQLTAGTIQYARELDAIAKITGANRKELQKAQDAALSEQRFRAKMNELTRSGQSDLAQNLNLLQATVAQSAPGLSQGLRDIIAAGGAVTTDAAREAFTLTGGQIVGIAQRALSGEDIGNVLQGLATSVQGGTERFESLAKVADLSPIIGNFAEASDFGRLSLNQLGEELQKQRGIQQKQSEGADELTSNTVKAQREMEQFSNKMADLSLSLTKVAAPAVAKFGATINDMLDELSERLGIDLGRRKQLEQERQQQAASRFEEEQAATSIMSGVDVQDMTTPRAPGEMAGNSFTRGIGNFLRGLGFGPKAGGGEAGSGTARQDMTTPRAPGEMAGTANQQDLEAMGLKIKTGDVQADNAPLSPKLIDLAKKIQSEVPNFSYFSGFNDRFHNVMSPSSKHTEGLALDFVVGNYTPEMAAEIMSQLKGFGASHVRDEYANPSTNATGPHFHVEIPEFLKGGIASGPESGYPALLHGQEAVVPLPDGKSIPVSTSPEPAAPRSETSSVNDNYRLINDQVRMMSEQLVKNDNYRLINDQVRMMGEQLVKLDSLIDAVRATNSINNKILQASQG